MDHKYPDVKITVEHHPNFLDGSHSFDITMEQSSEDVRWSYCLHLNEKAFKFLIIKACDMWVKRDRTISAEKDVAWGEPISSFSLPGGVEDEKEASTIAQAMRKGKGRVLDGVHPDAKA